jgi:glutathione S-transferase
MILVGRYLSPFVRRVGTTLQWLGIDYEHRSLSPALDTEAVRPFNPMIKVPALVLDDGEILIESSAILDSVLETVPGKTKRPKEKIHEPFLETLVVQAQAGFDQIDAQVAAGQLAGTRNPTIADITAAVGYTFASTMLPEACNAERHGALAAFAQTFEETEAFKACQFQV